jgi:hypothetical protein
MWAVDRWLIDPHIVPALNRLRREQGLRPVSRVFKDWLHSPRRVIALFPEWFAPVQPDWPPQLLLTGFPLYDETDAHAVSADLDAFLNAGQPPILFTPGSANRMAASFFAAALEAAERLGRRALFLTAYPDQLPAARPERATKATCRFRRSSPLRRGRITRVSATAQALAAGIPVDDANGPINRQHHATLGLVQQLVVPNRFNGERGRGACGVLDDPRTSERGGTGPRR